MIQTVLLCLTLLAMIVGILYVQRLVHGLRADARGKNPLPSPKATVELAAPPDGATELMSASSDLDIVARDIFGTEDRLAQGDLIVQLVDDRHAVVLGTRDQATRMGEVVGGAAETLKHGVRGASTAAEAGIEGAKATGHLVQLSPESREALRNLQTIRQEGKYVVAVLRDDGKKIRHLVRFKEVKKLQTLASGTAILSAIAGQAQLDSIEKELKKIGQDVSAIREDAKDEHTADVYGVLRLLREIYASARASEQLTPAMWDQIAPLAQKVYALQEMTQLKLQRAIHDISNLPRTAKEREDRFNAFSRQIEDALVSNIDEVRAVTQFQLLRIWHLSQQNDPSIQVFLEAATADDRRRRTGLRELDTSLRAALADADVKSRWQKRRVIRRRRLIKTVAEFGTIYQSHIERLLALPSLEAPTTASDELLALDKADELDREPGVQTISEPQTGGEV